MMTTLFPSIETTDKINPALYKELRQMRNSALPWLTMGGMLLIELLTALVLYIVAVNAGNAPDINNINVTLNVSAFLSSLLILISAFPLIHLTTLQRKVDGSDPLWGTSLSVWDVILRKLEAIFCMDFLLILCMLPLWLFATLYYHSWNWVNSFHCALGIFTLQTCMLSLSFYRSEHFNFPFFWMMAMPFSLPLIILPACSSFGARILFGMQVVYASVCLSLIALALCQAYSFLQHTQRDRDTPMRACIFLLTPIWLLVTYVYFFQSSGCEQSLYYDAFCDVWAYPISFALICYMIWCSFGDLLPTRRIRSELPKSALLRALRLPFVSGAINGIIFSTILMLLIDAIILYISANMSTSAPNVSTISDMSLPMLFGWLQYALFYSGIILFFRQHCRKRFTLITLIGIAILLVIVPAPLAMMLDLPEVSYLSPLYLNLFMDEHLNSLTGDPEFKHTIWMMQVRIIPLLAIGLALLYMPCKRYFAALNQDA